MTSTNSTKLIEMTPTEKFFYYGSLVGDEYVNGIIITNEIHIELDDVLIKQVMYYIYKRHPLLRAHIYEDLIMKKLYFELVEHSTEMTIEDMTFERSKVRNRAELILEMEKFALKIFEYEKKCLLWRIKMFEFEEENQRKYSFILVVPMFMTDGINITTLCIEFVNILNCLLTGQECHEMREELELIDSLEKIIEKNNLVTAQHREEFEKYRRNELKVYHKLPDKFINIKDFGYKMNFLKIDKTITQELRKYAKQNHIKLNGLLVSATFYALKELYEENGLLMPKDVSIMIPINLRFRVEPNIDFSHIRTCVTSCGLDLVYPNFGKYENILEDAKYIDKCVVEKIVNGVMFDFIDDGYFNEITDLYNQINDHSVMSALLESKRNFDIVLSNTGTYVSDRKKVIEGPVKIEELYYGDSLSSYPTMFAPLVMHIHTFNDQLMLQLSSNRRKLSENFMNRFIDLYEKQLKNTVVF